MVQAMRRTGFSLVELLVVLALVGLVLGLALPNLAGLLDSVTRATEREYILDQIAAAGRAAAQRGIDYAILDTPAPDAPDSNAAAAAPPGVQRYPLDVPPAWRVQVEQPVLVRASGVCLGGIITVAHGDGPPTRLVLAPPHCRVAADA